MDPFQLLLSESGLYSKQHISLENQLLDRSELSRGVDKKRFKYLSIATFRHNMIIWCSFSDKLAQTRRLI